MYCSIIDLINDITYDTLLQLINDENIEPSLINLNGENIYSDRIFEQINKAKYEIDFYLNNKLVIDVNNIPPIIKTIARDITVYYLYKRRFLSKVPKGVLANYNDRIIQLKDIAAGNLSIVFDNNASQKYLTNKTKNDRMFTLEDYV